MWQHHAVQAFLIAAVVSPFSYYAGSVAKQLNLPQITGYLVSGVLCGPYVLGILSQASVGDLNIIEGACLGIIGLAAGAELQLSELNRAKRQVVCLTAGICVLTWVLCYLTISWSAPLTPVLHVTTGQLAAIASLGGTLMMARSPASAIAVLKEMDAKGPFASLVMGVVVLKDVVVIVLFALNMELVPMIISHSSAFGLMHVMLPLLSVTMSLTAGIIGGLLISLVLQRQLHTHIAASVAKARGVAGSNHTLLLLRSKQLLVLLLATALFSVVRALDAEPLLACVTAGMLLANRQAAGSGEASQEELAGLINSIMVVTNIAFFGLAGASLKLDAIANSVWIALMVFFARLAAIIGGSWLGCRASAVRSEQQHYFWMSMVTQAGVAMGLARIAGTAFADWGPSFQTVMMAIIMINMLVGPPMFRMALIKVGEAHAHSIPSSMLQQQGLHRDMSVVSDTTDAVITRSNSSRAAAKGGKGAVSGAPSPLNGSSSKLDGSPGKVGLPPDPGRQHADVRHVVVSSEALLHDLAGGTIKNSAD